MGVSPTKIKRNKTNEHNETRNIKIQRSGTDHRPSTPLKTHFSPTLERWVLYHWGGRNTKLVCLNVVKCHLQENTGLVLSRYKLGTLWSCWVFVQYVTQKKLNPKKPNKKFSISMSAGKHTEATHGGNTRRCKQEEFLWLWVFSWSKKKPADPTAEKGKKKNRNSTEQTGSHSRTGAEDDAARRGSTAASRRAGLGGHKANTPPPIMWKPHLGWQSGPPGAGDTSGEGAQGEGETRHHENRGSPPPGARSGHGQGLGKKGYDFDGLRTGGTI